MRRHHAHAAARWLVAVSLVAMLVFGFASSRLLDEDSFAELVSSSVEDPEVRRLLAAKAVDIVLEAANADVFLAGALPGEISAVATPVLELSKPAIAAAGAGLLRVDAVEAGLEAAARSVHRQTAGAIVAEDDVDVVLNARPVLVVVADEIVGDVGARSVVGLDLPETATSINFGSNQTAGWSLVRALDYVAGSALIVWLAAIASYFATAERGARLHATRRLGRTYALAGVATAVLAWIGVEVTGAVVEVVLTPGETLSLAELSLGTQSSGGGTALAQVMFGPLLGAARRTVVVGLLIVAATYVFGRGEVARGLRSAVRRRTSAPLVPALKSEFPAHVRHTRVGLVIGLVVLLIIWPQITLRVVLTLTALAVAALVSITVVTRTGSPWRHVRQWLSIEHIAPTDAGARTERASALRRRTAAAAFAFALVWPSYDAAGMSTLVVLVAASYALTYRWELRAADREVDQGVAPEPAGTDRSRSPLRTRVVLGAVTAAGVAALVFGGDNANPASAGALGIGEPVQCNGSAALCDRRIDEIVLAGTHNSMSASELGWQLANHDGAIPAQLAGGIRALLIDVQYWPQGAAVDDLYADPQAAAIAAQVLDVAQAPEDGLWMCHNLCQLGGTPFEDFLADLRAFVETHPDEVVMIVIQDDAPAQDIKAAIEAAGVDRYAYAHEPGTEWPTLGEMIERNERLVFFAENDADDDGWYQRAFDGNVSDTGFRYSVLEEFDCATNRGSDDSPFFMINHWVETGLPVPAEADRVNSRALLEKRIEECLEVQGRLPSIIAVNFWERGDLLAVVAELNG